MKILRVLTTAITWAVWISPTQGCKPIRPRVQYIGCMKERINTSTDGDIIKVVDNSDVYCQYKNVWTVGGSVEYAPNYNNSDYLKVYKYLQPASNQVTFEGCTTIPSAQTYSVTQWYCTEFCLANCTSIAARHADGSNAFAFKKIKCTISNYMMACKDTLDCTCTDTEGATCSTMEKKATVTMGAIIDKYNSSCLNCYYNRTRAENCTWKYWTTV